MFSNLILTLEELLQDVDKDIQHLKQVSRGEKEPQDSNICLDFLRLEMKCPNKSISFSPFFLFTNM